MIRIPGKIPIFIHPLFWLIALVIAFLWTQSLMGMLVGLVVILVSVLCHEFGHALTAIAFGQQTRIELAAFGGFTYRTGRKLKLWEEFLIVLNGPLAGFGLFGLSYLALRVLPAEGPAVLLFALNFTMMVNLFWTVINLVPVLPLDGGHLLSILLQSIFGYRGIRMAIIAGIVIGIAISIFFLVVGAWIIAALFFLLVFESFRSLRYYKLYNEKDQDNNLQELFKGAEKDLVAGNRTQAMTKFQQVREQSGKGLLCSLATQELASLLHKEERYQEAYELLLPIRKEVSSENMPLFHHLAYMNRDFQVVVEVGNQSYQLSPTYETAFINAVAHSVLGKAEAAIGWLECSIREGLPHPEEAAKRSEFDSIRSLPSFRTLLDRLNS